MDEETKNKIDALLKLEQDNNLMLHKIRGSQKTTAMLRAIYWVILIALTFGAYVYVQPYTDKIMSLYSSASGNLDALKNLSNSSGFGSFNGSGSTKTK